MMTQPLSGLTVLLVEDDFMVLDEFKDMLEGAGADVVTATSLNDGLRLSDKCYDAAILDIRLPDGDVFPIAERLSDAQTALIFLSGQVDRTEAVARFPSSIALNKPVPEHDLINAVKQYAPPA